MAIPYYHVDAFTDELFAGNPAGVCIPFPLSRAISIMQKLPAENKHSKTAFVVLVLMVISTCAGLRPTIEDDLCGHATLASRLCCSRCGKHNAWPVFASTPLPACDRRSQHDSFELDFPTRPPQPCETPAGLLPALGLKAGAGNEIAGDFVVVVDHAEQVRALSPDYCALATLDIVNAGTIVTWLPARVLDYVCRLFCTALRH